MKKNFLLLVMMCLLGGFSSSLLAQEIQIGEGTGGTSNGQYVPIYIGNSNTYAISQQIYFANEIKMPNGGTITQISFYTYNNKWTRNIEIYMTHTSKTTFTANNQWESVGAANKVFSGDVEFGSGNTTDIVWVTITLDKGFTYDGKSNLLLCVNDLTGTKTFDSNYPRFRTNSTAKSNTVIYKYGSKITDPSTQLSSLNGTRKAYRNIIKLTFGGAAEKKTPVFTDTYAYPNGTTSIFNPYLSFFAENKTHYKVLLSTKEDFSSDVRYVAGSATEWVNDEEKQIYTSTVEGLNYAEETTYYWKVNASNGGGADDPTAESIVYSFTTKQVTEKPGQITDAYPNGEQGLVNPEFTWTFGSDTEEYQVLIDGEAKTEWTNPGSSTTGSYQTSGLAAGEHTWRIDARNTVGTTTGTEYSFSIASLPDNVTPVSPVDGATGVTSSKIRFEFADGTEEYRFLYGESANALAYCGHGTATTWLETNGISTMEIEAPYFQTGKKYYWAVDVKNSIGKRSVYQNGTGDEAVAIYSFTAASTLPVVNTAPDNGAFNLDNPELKWNYVGAARHYMVYLGTDENSLEAKTDWIARETTSTGYVGNGSYQTENLTAATPYFWRVDIKDEAGNVIPGEKWSFVTTLKAPQDVQASPANVEPSYSLKYGETTIMWSTNDMTSVLCYNVYLNGEKLNNEPIAPTKNSYKIEATTMKLTYNMNPGHKVEVEAVYDLGTSKSEIYVKVSGAGYFVGKFYSNDFNHRLADATVTLTRTKDDFGNEYDGNGKQYTYTTNSEGDVYYEQQIGEETSTITKIGILDGTYNVTVEKACYETYEGTIDITNGSTSAIGGYDGSGLYGVILKADPAVMFNVSCKENTFNSIKIYLENTDWIDNNEYNDEGQVTKYFGEGYYYVYLKNGEEITELEAPVWFSQDGQSSVYCIYNDWAFLGKGNYQFGVAKVEEQINWSSAATRNYDVFEGRTDEWSKAKNWRDGELPSENANVYILSPLTIAADENITTGTITMQGDESKITINGSLTADMVYNKAKAGDLCINDGGQLRQNNTDLNGKFVMDIVRPSDADLENWGQGVTAETGWQFISSPITNAAVSQFVTANTATTGDYDLYKYDGSKENEWVNHKANADFETNFVSGRGYLASYNLLEEATLSGTLNAAKTFERQYSYTKPVEDKDDLKNCFLVGNPFTFNMDLKNMTSWNNVVEGVAIVDANGDYEYLTTNDIIPVGDGFFIQTTGEYPSPSISYAEGTGSKRGEKVESINVVASSKAGKDNVVINFASDKKGFLKLENFNNETANIFVSNKGRNYGIYNCNRNVNEVALSFIPKQMGSYTISLDINGDFESVVLVDRLTGVETDMLVENEYSFIATKEDNQNRFFIRLANGEEPSSENSQFVYQSGEELIIEAEGTIQIIDMMGRVVYNNEVENSRINISNFNKASYIVRNINEKEVKVQKIVIY
ncbi:MAG: T9SS type A sorting domain-containing protein [Bacteroidales bacterium]|nr:T9SS type A sorting domain-containing protein [Bacteroidales bacterium]